MAHDPGQDLGLVGTVLGGYELKKLRRVTKSTLVFEAADPRLGERRTFVKVLRPEVRDSRLELFRKEGLRHGVLEHPSVASIYAAGDDRGFSYIAMEYVEGDDLATKLKNGVYLGPHAQTIVLDLAEALRHCHAQGVHHKDVKPANVIQRNTDGKIVLVDIGGRSSEHPDPPTNDVVALGLFGLELMTCNASRPARFTWGLESVFRRAADGKYTEIGTLVEDIKICGRRKALTHVGATVAGTLALGAGALLGYRSITYPKTAQSVVDRIGGLDTGSTDQDYWVGELKKRLFSEKVLPVARTFVPQRVFPFATRRDEDGNWKWVTYQYPHSSNGFWPGLLLEGYQKTKSQELLDLGLKAADTMNFSDEDRHQTTAARFLPGHKRAYAITRGQRYLDAIVQAADVFAGRFDERAGFIPSDLKEGVLTSEAGMMGDVVPLLYETFELTGEQRYKTVADAHVLRAKELHIRGDGSVRKTVAIRDYDFVHAEQRNSKGVRPDSTSTRSLVSVMRGLIAHTRNGGASEDDVSWLADYMLQRLDDQELTPLDLDSREVHVPTDSSAAAMALQPLSQLAIATGDTNYQEAKQRMLTSIIRNCVNCSQKNDGVLLHACEGYRGPDNNQNMGGALIAGDYFFLSS